MNTPDTASPPAATFQPVELIKGTTQSLEADFHPGDADDASTVNDTQCEDTLQWVANARTSLAAAIQERITHCGLPSSLAINQLLSLLSDQDRIFLIHNRHPSRLISTYVSSHQ